MHYPSHRLSNFWQVEKENVRGSSMKLILNIYDVRRNVQPVSPSITRVVMHVKSQKDVISYRGVIAL